MPTNEIQANLIITRPAPFAEQLEQLIRADSACMAHQLNIVTQPLIQFSSNPDLTNNTLISAFKNSNVAIFISQQAVDYALTRPDFMATLASELPPLVIAVGASTQARLAHYGVESVCPKTSNSEGMIDLLQQSPFIMARSVVLIRGNKGRALLEAFLQRQFTLETIEVYQRQAISNVSLPERFDASLPTAMIATSGQLLRLGCELLKSANFAIKNCSIISGSDRISHMAQQFGFEHCYTAQNATNQELMVTCREWLEKQS